MFRVINTVILDDHEKGAIENKESLFFYHTWNRSESELIEIAHDILSTHCDNGKNSNYNDTSYCKVVESIQKQMENNPDNFRLNSPFTGKFEWIEECNMSEVYEDIMCRLNDMINDVYSMEDYSCGYHEGDWGLFHSDIFEG